MFKRLWRPAVGAMVIVSLCAGCAQRRCGPEVRRARAPEDNPEFDLRAAVRARLAQKGPGQQPLSVLVLSGGGAYGAWGAGVLHGWRESQGDPRPQSFDVVTGISTGALLATFAFLGDAADDDVAKRAYTTTRTPDIYRQRWLLGVPFSNSLYDTRPMKGMIAKYISDEVIRRVGRERQANRRLYVGTVNLDSGRLHVWDMTALAAEGNFDRYRRVVLAAAAIPVMFPPVPIQGHLHADGGTRSQLFLRKRLVPIAEEVKSAVRAAKAAPPGRGGVAATQGDDREEVKRRLRVYVIVNGSVGLGRICVNNHILSIAMRSAENLIDATGIGDLHRVQCLAHDQGFDFRLSLYDPGDEPAVSVPLQDFDPAKMLKLYQQGEKWGSRDNWKHEVPDIPEDEF